MTNYYSVGKIHIEGKESSIRRFLKEGLEGIDNDDVVIDFDDYYLNKRARISGTNDAVVFSEYRGAYYTSASGNIRCVEFGFDEPEEVEIEPLLSICKKYDVDICLTAFNPKSQVVFHIDIRDGEIVEHLRTHYDAMFWEYIYDVYIEPALCIY